MQVEVELTNLDVEDTQERPIEIVAQELQDAMCQWRCVLQKRA